MKFVSPSHFTDPDAAVRKLVQIANASEAVQDGRIYIELLNNAFLKEGGTPDQYRAALARAVTLGWLWLHESGTYVPFKPAGVNRELFVMTETQHIDLLKGRERKNASCAQQAMLSSIRYRSTITNWCRPVCSRTHRLRQRAP